MFSKTDIEIINRMRLDGFGYKAIAKAVHSTRDRVRGYCIKHNLTGFGEVVTDNLNIMKEQNLVCAYCNKTIKQNGRGRVRKFCSDECRRNWWTENKDKGNKKDRAIYKFKCKYCGREFTCYGNKRRKYCSRDCYFKSRFWKGEDDGI